jgi:choline dehydrogenase
LHWPRGKVVGGSGALNAMIWARGVAADYDHWAYLGNAGWGWSDVLAVYRRIEDFDQGASAMHGAGGPLRVLTQYEPAPLHQAFVEAAGQAGIPFNPDYNAGDPSGISYTQLTISEGRRHSPAAAYLRPVLEHSSLMLITDAHVQRLLLEGNRCVGVEYVRDGRLERATAGSEVILSAGTIESPRLLMLSGIGPADHLRALGLDVVGDLPGVGENLHDHLISPLIFSAERVIEQFAPGLPPGQSHLFAHSRPGLVAPDLQPIHFSVPLLEEWMEPITNGFSLMAGMIRPLSRGTLRLRSADPGDELALDPGTLREGADLERLVDALELSRRMGEAPVLAEWGATERYPGPDVRSREALRDYARRTAITYHHQVGTCKMGIDALAVVDPELRVYGIEGLRVADASIMPAVTTGNTNAPSVMIGERAGDFVAGAGHAGLTSATSDTSPPLATSST